MGRGEGMRFLGILFAVACMFLAGCTGGIMCIMTEQPAGAGHKRLQDQGNGTCLDVKTGKLWQMAKSKRVKSLEEASLRA